MSTAPAMSNAAVMTPAACVATQPLCMPGACARHCCLRNSLQHAALQGMRCWKLLYLRRQLVCIFNDNILAGGSIGSTASGSTVSRCPCRFVALPPLPGLLPMFAGDQLLLQCPIQLAAEVYENMTSWTLENSASSQAPMEKYRQSLNVQMAHRVLQVSEFCWNHLYAKFGAILGAVPLNTAGGRHSEAAA